MKTNLLQKEVEHRWVPVENYHCTLNFLGEVDSLLLPELEALLTEVATRHSSFDLKISGVDAFPEIQSGRVIYAGVQNSKELRSLQEDCLNVLRDKFHPEERAYIPHLTVARLRNPRNLKDIISPVKNQDFGKLHVPEIVLYESVSHGAFPVYKPLFRKQLTVNG